MKEDELTYILNLLDQLTGEIYDVSFNIYKILFKFHFEF